MTNKEFFIKTLEAEQPVFVKVIKALPPDKLGYKPDEKARSAGHIAYQLALQQSAMSGVITVGKPQFGDTTKYRAGEYPSVDEMVAEAEKNFVQVKKDLAAISDEDWENGMGKMEFPGGKWEDKKYNMVWGFLFDAVHHRGQLTAYLRAMGAKVPSVYGGSADERPGA